MVTIHLDILSYLSNHKHRALLQAFQNIECYHNGREGKACSSLKYRYLADKKRFGQMILTLRGMRNTDKFFADQPFSPSTLDTFWNKIEVQLEKGTPEAKPKPEGPTAEEVIAEKKRQMDAEGWKYNDALDSLVHEAYTDFLHDKAKKKAKNITG